MNCKICNAIINRQEDGIILESRKLNDFKKEVKDEVFICEECNKYPLPLIKAYTKVGDYLIELSNGSVIRLTNAIYINRIWVQLKGGLVTVGGVQTESGVFIKIDEISGLAETFINPVP